MSLKHHKKIEGAEPDTHSQNHDTQQHSSEQTTNDPTHTSHEVKVDLTRPKRESRTSFFSPKTKAVGTPNQHRVRNGFLIAAALLGIGLVGFGTYAYTLTKNQIVEKDNQGNFFDQVHNIVDRKSEPLKGEEEDRINIAMFGIGGEGHEGGTLADTIMVASIKPSTNEVALISIPRDFNVAFYAEGSKYPEYHKINSAIFRGGNEMAVEKVEEVTGLDIPYFVVADFDGFRDVIDSLGGVDIDVTNAFVDRQYPDYNYGWQVISFDEGMQHMEGETALQYARSRHGNNGEGSDFKRAERQQKVLEAVKEEALSGSTYLNPATVTKVLQNLGDHIATNAEIWEMVRFAEIAQNIERDTIVNTVLDNGPEGLVYIDNTNGSNIIPNAGLGEYDEIHAFIQAIFASDSTSVAEENATNANESATNEDTTATEDKEPTKTAEEENAVIVIQNGTSITGLAGTTAETVYAEGVTVAHVGNARIRTNTETVIYDLSNGAAPETLALLKKQIGGEVRKATLPDSEFSVRLATDVDPTIVDLSTVPENVDFIVVLGTDAAKQ